MTATVSPMNRRTVVLAFVFAGAWQFFFGAYTSLQIAAPGVGERAAWVPGILVAEAYSLLPIGFALCLWGSRVGRLMAVACAIASLALAVVAVTTLSSSQSSFIFSLPLLAVPGLTLLYCAWRGRPSSGGTA